LERGRATYKERAGVNFVTLTKKKRGHGAIFGGGEKRDKRRRPLERVAKKKRKARRVENRLSYE